MKRWMRALRFIGLGLALAYALPAACGSGGVVGGKCRGGYSNCNGQCVALQSDVDNCGTCGTVCAADEGCGEGVCDPDVPRPQGGASNLGGASNQSGNGAAGNDQVGGNGELPDGGFFDSPVDGQSDAEAPVECLPPHDSPSHCGDCDTRCPVDAPLCQPTEDGSSFECVPVCKDPLVECRGECVLAPDAYQSDPENCGKCGRECPSDICQLGVCVGARYGNIALLCMDLNSSMTNSGPADLLANAVLIPNVNPVKVLSYTRGATPAAVTKVHALINAKAGERGRAVSITEAKTEAAVTNNLGIAAYQVLLVHDLDLAAPGEAASTATAWESSSTISSFSKAGGVVIVLSGSDGTGEMHEFITASNVLQGASSTLVVTGQTEITGLTVYNLAGGDVVGVNVVDQFRGTSHTCSFETSGSDDDSFSVVGTDLGKNGGGEPVVIHRVIKP
jgi:phage tail protein X